jgi:RsiW-degrading membrane proteinase PrsW (M82 family)
MAEPKVPEVTKPSDPITQSYEVRMLAEMGETHAKALRDVAKNTYAVPARQETYRLLILVLFALVLLYFLLPAFLQRNPTDTTIGAVIVVVVALIGGPSVIKSLKDIWKS